MGVSNRQGNKGLKSKAYIKVDGAAKWENVKRRDSRTMKTPGVAVTGIKRWSD